MCGTCKRKTWRHVYHFCLSDDGGSLSNVCEVCDRSFQTLKKYRVHFRTHTGSNPYSCSAESCTKSYVSKPMLLKHQVWTLTQFFTVSFLYKLIDLPLGQINDPSSGKHYSLPFLPATSLSPPRTLKGLFELTQRPSRALASPRALLPRLQRIKDIVKCVTLDP